MLSNSPRFRSRTRRPVYHVAESVHPLCVSRLAPVVLPVKVSLVSVYTARKIIWHLQMPSDWKLKHKSINMFRKLENKTLSKSRLLVVDVKPGVLNAFQTRKFVLEGVQNTISPKRYSETYLVFIRRPSFAKF